MTNRTVQHALNQEKSLLPIKNHHAVWREEGFSKRRSLAPKSASPTSSTGLSTPPMLMPESSHDTRQVDLEYVMTVQKLESEEWEMWELLSSHGLNVQPPGNDPVMAPPSQPRLHGFTSSAELEMFVIDL
mmetsp:Transcript_79213/g.158198  ORF Transcript_79213/g.158198 Transcript_79213/m.158198 type:complete len:130 (+) Transcript_79213:148-537(+)